MHCTTVPRLHAYCFASSIDFVGLQLSALKYALGRYCGKRGAKDTEELLNAANSVFASDKVCTSAALDFNACKEYALKI